MACPDHERRQKIMVCVPCKTVVCELCIEDSHNGHQLKTFETAAKAVICDLMKLTESPGFTTLVKDFRDFSAIQQREGGHAIVTKQELLDRRDHIKQVLDQVTELAVTKLNQHNENLFRELGEVNDNARKQFQTVQEFKDEVEKLQTSQNYLEVVEHGWKLKTPEITKLEFPKVARLKFMPDMPVDTPNIEMLFGELVQQDLYAPTTFHPHRTFSMPVLGHYNPNPSLASSICTHDLFGEGPEGVTSTRIHPAGPTDESTQLNLLQNTQSLKCEVKLTQTGSFKLPSSARVMQPTVEGNCWINYIGDVNTITLVSKNGDMIKVVPLTTSVLGILSLPVTNQVLLACPDKKGQQLNVVPMKYGLATSTKIHTGTLSPFRMCTTSNGDILVTLTDKKSLSVELNSTSVLIKYNSKGKELARVHKDGHGQDLFFVPHNISISNTGTVAVVNYTDTDPYASHLVVLDDKLNLIHMQVHFPWSNSSC